MAIRLKLEGNKALIKGLDKANKKVRSIVGDNIQAAGYDIRAKASSTVTSYIQDNGTLEKLLTEQYDPQTLTSVVESRAHYSPYVEFGTGTKVRIPQGLENYASQFRGKGIKEVNLPPRPFLFPAAFAEYPKMIKRIKNEISKEL